MERLFLSCAAHFRRDISRAARPQCKPARFRFVRNLPISGTPAKRRMCPISGKPDIGWATKVPSAGVAELVDARDLGSRDESRGGSSPSARTTQKGTARGLILSMSGLPDIDAKSMPGLSD